MLIHLSLDVIKIRQEIFKICTKRKHYIHTLKMDNKVIPLSKE